MSRKIVIVGAGYAGVLTAKKLAKKFKRNDEVTITLIDKNPYHVMLTELHEVAARRVDEESIRADLKKIFARRKVDVVLDTVTEIDFKGKKVIGENNTYEYDQVVLSAGSKPTYYGIPGAVEHVLKLWSYDDAITLRNHIEDTFAKACRETDPEKRKQMLTFFVVGAGFTGVEMVGELAEYAPILAAKFGIDYEEVAINIVDFLDRMIPTLPDKLAIKAERRLKKMGVNIILGSKVCEVGDGYIKLMQGDTCVQFETNTVIWSAGIESADITGKAAEVLESAARNRIKTDKYLRAMNNKDVFVIGDNMLYTPEEEEAPVPQVVENCEHGASTAAHNIEVTITGEGEMEEYKPKLHGFMVCIGGRYGLAHVGTANKKICLPSFLAMFVKHFINIVYFIQILGWNKVFSYMKHEFFTVRNDRSFVGGHFSNKTPSFLLVPLRMWLGAVWLFEGIKKIGEGWFKNPKLVDFFGGATAWFDSITGGGADGGSAATEAVTAATGVAGEGAQAAGTTLMNWNFLGIFRAIFVSGTEVADATLADFAFKLDVPLINWFVDKLVLSSDTMQIIMQVAIVVMEILIGLALMGGLFTFLSSGASLVLQFMFVTTTGAYLSTFWMIFAAIAVLIGGGRIFGFDYYVMPPLKRWWKKTKVARKLYIYHD